MAVSTHTFHSISTEKSIWTPSDNEMSFMRSGNKIDVVIHNTPSVQQYGNNMMPQQSMYYHTPYGAYAPYPQYMGMMNCIQVRLQQRMKDALMKQKSLSDRRKSLIECAGSAIEIETLTQQIDALTGTMISLQRSLCNMFGGQTQ